MEPLNEDDGSSGDKVPSLASSTTSTRPKRYYASTTHKPFSKSAAKRSSVMALGSIAHLQHFYVKHGLAASEPPSSIRRGGLVLALPGQALNADGTLASSPTEMHLPFLPSQADDMPPSPMPPEPPKRLPFQLGEEFKKDYDLGELKNDVVEKMEDVCDRWEIIEHVKRIHRMASFDSSFSEGSRSTSPAPAAGHAISSSLEDEPQESFILALLHSTTQAIRSVQRYVLALPADTLPSSTAPATSRHQSHLGVVTTARRTSMSPPASLSSRSSSPLHPVPNKSLSQAASEGPLSSPEKGKGREDEDPLVLLRRSSLEMLGALKDMEQRFRIDNPVQNADAEEGQEELLVSSLVRASIDDDQSVEEAQAALQQEDQKGHLYKSDITLDDLKAEKDAVRVYIEVVDRVLQAVEAKNPRKKAARGKRRGRESSMGFGEGRRVASFGDASTALRDDGPAGGTLPVPRLKSPEPFGDDDDDLEDDLPDWARLDRFVEEPQGRVHAFLVAHLPPDLLDRLTPPHGEGGSPPAFWEGLADGHLMCLAYNSALRKSERPWGFIPNSSIHDLVAIQSAPEPVRPGIRPAKPKEEDASAPRERVGLTFRKIENLRVWAAALKIRYMVHLLADVKGSSTSSSDPSSFGRAAFEPKVVGRKDEGWQLMLEDAVLRWVDAVVAEKRAEVYGR